MSKQPPVNRRSFLKSAAVTGAAALTGGVAPPAAQAPQVDFASVLKGSVDRIDQAQHAANTLAERFQLGGEQSLRGFQQGAVVPLHPENHQVFTDADGRILGGNKFFVLNVEYQFLQVGPAKVLAFVDVGNNYAESQNFDFTNIRSSAKPGRNTASKLRPRASSIEAT